MRAHKLRMAGFVFIAGCILFRMVAAETVPSPSQMKRAERLVREMNLESETVSKQISGLIARHYAELSAIHAVRDAELQAARNLHSTDKTASDEGVRAAQSRALEAQGTLHRQFLAGLARDLTPAQIDQVKDGMTYGVLPLTFRVYQEMLPDLTAAQKSQILAWLTEARELAMDGGSSEEKHAIFGKYKGRINNYLSAAGIDMKRAEHDMLARKKSAGIPSR